MLGCPGYAGSLFKQQDVALGRAIRRFPGIRSILRSRGAGSARRSPERAPRRTRAHFDCASARMSARECACAPDGASLGTGGGLARRPDHGEPELLDRPDDRHETVEADGLRHVAVRVRPVRAEDVLLGARAGVATLRRMRRLLSRSASRVSSASAGLSSTSGISNGSHMVGEGWSNVSVDNHLRQIDRVLRGAGA
jgi:hypothetical protein